MPVVENPDGTLWIHIRENGEVDAVRERLTELGVPVTALVPDPGSDVSVEEVDWGDVYPKVVLRNGSEPGIIVQPGAIPPGHTLLLATQTLTGAPSGHEVVTVLRLVRGPALGQFGNPPLRSARPPRAARLRPGRPPGGSPTEMNGALAAELKAMVQEDQRIRKPAPGQEKRFAVRMSVEQTMEWRRVDVSNTDRLREIIERYGWPGRSLVGEEGADHAWLLAQHADRQLDLQRQALVLIAEAVALGEATPRQLAYLTDRVRMNEGRQQVYGTQIAEVRDGVGVPWPVENRDELDARPAAVGLEPFEQYAAQWSDLNED